MITSRTYPAYKAASIRTATALLAILALLVVSAQADRAAAQGLPTYDQVEPGQSLAIDGVWELSINKAKVMIEGGHVFAIDPWMHMVFWPVEPGNVTSTDITPTGPGTFTATDLLLQRKMTWTLNADGSITGSGTGVLAPTFTMLPLELAYPEAFQELLLVAAEAATPPGPLDVDLNPEQLIMSDDGMCLDVNGPDARSNGGRVQVWECNGGVNQRFAYLAEDALILTGSGMCLDATGNANGTLVVSNACTAEATQLWEPIGEGAIILRHAATGKCLDVHGPDRGKNGGKVQLWDCNLGSNQKWAM